MSVNNQRVEEVYQLAVQKLSFEERRVLSLKLGVDSEEISVEDKVLQDLEDEGLLAPFPKGLSKYIIDVEGLAEDRLLEVKGKPLSEIIIEERR